MHNHKDYIFTTRSLEGTFIRCQILGKWEDLSLLDALHKHFDDWFRRLFKTDGLTLTEVCRWLDKQGLLVVLLDYLTPKNLGKTL